MAGERLHRDGYIPRIVDAQIERYLRVFGAVEIAGTKWCGKTWAALEHGASVSYVDENLDLARADPAMMLLGDRPHIIDEWQRVPQIWNYVRHEVDRARGTRGAYILTGSATPAFGSKAEAPAHSGAGRIGRVRMHPMTLVETGESNGKVSLAGLFEHRFEPCRCDGDTPGLVEAACRGGWPEAIDMVSADAQLIVREYLNTTFSSSFPAVGLDPDIARRVSASIARNLGRATTYKTILMDMFGAEEEPAAFADETKVRRYLDALKGMFILEEVPGWVPAARDKRRFTVKPKRYLADPSLACALLGMSLQALLADWQTFGLVFENMVIRDLSVYARSLDQEREFVQEVGDIDVLKLGHHGSKVSVDGELLDVLRPELSLASAGKGNRYGHPSDACIDAVQEAGGAFACTIEHGDITISPTAKGFAMRCQRP